jgi:hypothetical protein
MAKSFKICFVKKLYVLFPKAKILNRSNCTKGEMQALKVLGHHMNILFKVYKIKSVLSLHVPVVSKLFW